MSNRLAFGSFIPRRYTVAYLARCGLVHDGYDADPDIQRNDHALTQGVATIGQTSYQICHQPSSSVDVSPQSLYISQQSYRYDQ